MRHYDLRDGLPQTQVTAIFQDRMGFLWVGTATGGLGRYDGRHWEVFDAASGLPGTRVHTVVEDGQGTLIVGTGGGAARLQAGGFVPLQASGQALRRNVVAVLPLPEGTVLLGTNAGLLEWSGDDRPAIEFHLPESPRGTEITALARDREGVVYVGTTQGLARLDRTRAPGLELVPGLPPGGVLALLARAGRPLLVSIADQGVFEGGPAAFRRLGDDRAPGVRILSLLAEQDDPEVLWLGTDRRGAFCRRGARFEPFSTTEGLSNNRVPALFEDREGILWFGTDSALTKRGTSSFVRFDEADGFAPEMPIFGMAESRDGALWFSAWDGGLARLPRQGATRRFTMGDGLPDGRVVDVAAHPAGGVMVATRKGVARIEGDRVKPVALPGRVSLDVRSVIVGPDGRIYLGTRDAGLVILHPERPPGGSGDAGGQRHQRALPGPRRNALGRERRGRSLRHLPRAAGRRAADPRNRPAIEPGHLLPGRLTRRLLGDHRPGRLSARCGRPGAPARPKERPSRRVPLLGG